MATFWRAFHHDGKSAQPGEGEGWTPTPFHSIYPHVHSCSARSSWEGKYTPPIPTLPQFMNSVIPFYDSWFTGLLQEAYATCIPAESWILW